jgi:hypothetical protein
LSQPVFASISAIAFAQSSQRLCQYKSNIDQAFNPSVFSKALAIAIAQSSQI